MYGEPKKVLLGRIALRYALRAFLGFLVKPKNAHRANFEDYRVSYDLGRKFQENHNVSCAFVHVKLPKENSKDEIFVFNETLRATIWYSRARFWGRCKTENGLSIKILNTNRT